MQRFFIAAMVTVFLTSSVLGEETFFIIYDKAMHGCNLITDAPNLPTPNDIKRREDTARKVRPRRPSLPSRIAEPFSRSLRDV